MGSGAWGGIQRCVGRKVAGAVGLVGSAALGSEAHEKRAVAVVVDRRLGWWVAEHGAAGQRRGDK